LLHGIDTLVGYVDDLFQSIAGRLRGDACQQRRIAGWLRLIDGLFRGADGLVDLVPCRQRVITYRQWSIDGMERGIDGMETVPLICFFVWEWNSRWGETKRW